MNQDLFKKKEFLAGVGFTVGCLLALVAGSWFLTDKIMTSSAELKEEKASLEGTYKSWQDVRPVEKELEKIKPEVEKMEEGIISEKDQIEFLKTLESLAKKTSNLYKIVLLSGATNEENKEKALSFQIHLAGSYPNFMHFLGYLENLKYSLRVETLQVSEIKQESVIGVSEWENIPSGSVYSIISLKVFTK
ncbi:MAG: hypothetical protein V1845_03685 [bacterium]